MSTIVMSDTDPGEGASLANDNYIAVYGGKSILDIFYPVGCYFETSDSTFDPNIAWGGTWVEDSAGRVTVAYRSDVSQFNSIGKTGGEREHQLSETELPNISGTVQMHDAAVGTTIHNVSGKFSSSIYNATNYKAGGTTAYGAPSYGNFTFSFGGNGYHNNIQPYVVVKRWHRTA